MQTDLADKTIEVERREVEEPSLLSLRLFGLMRVIRESGVPRYEREIGYKEIHRHLIMMIGLGGGLSSQEIVAITGHEKAQVSRAIKPLEQQGLIARERLRAKLMLLAPGRKIFERITAISKVRDGLLIAGIASDDLQRFSQLAEQLKLQAADIYAEERRLSVEAGAISPGSPSATAPAWPGGSEPQPPPNLITPRLLGLVAYIKRAAMLGCQRTHGLSNFQWHVLALIGAHKGMPLAQLILAIGRDKSQVGRTVLHLEELGLIERSRPTRRREIMLQLSERGGVVFAAMYEMAAKREELLWAGHHPADRAFFASIVDRLKENARAMAAAEKG